MEGHRSRIRRLKHWLKANNDAPLEVRKASERELSYIEDDLARHRMERKRRTDHGREMVSTT